MSRKSDVKTWLKTTFQVFFFRYIVFLIKTFEDVLRHIIRHGLRHFLRHGLSYDLRPEFSSDNPGFIMDNYCLRLKK